MSLHQEAKNIEELKKIVGELAEEMLEGGEDGITQIWIRFNQEDDTFDVLSDE